MILNKEKETDSVIIFVHIPKTGGCTLNDIIYKQYEGYYDKKKPFIRTHPLSKYLEPYDKRKIEVLTGHFGFGVHKLLPQKNFTYITVLRNPIDRVVSLYYYLRRTKSHPSYHIVNHMTLYEYVSSERFKQATSNLQTHILSGYNGYDLETAKNNLKKHFSIIGITERYNETLQVIENNLGWKIHDYKIRNATLNRPSAKNIPNMTIRLIKMLNGKDMELYQFANKLLDEQLLKMQN